MSRDDLPRRRVDPSSEGQREARREETLRPARLDEFIGQPEVIRNLKVYILAARARSESLDHALFSGMPGLGKTTLAHLVAQELGTGFRSTSGPVLEKAKDLIGILTDLEDGDVLFIDEVHRIPHVVEEYLYSAMEDFCIDILIDQGPNARSVKIHLPRFTLIAATTREGSLTAPFRARFGIQEKLEAYPKAEMQEILERSARLLKVPLFPDGAELLAARCRGIPRIANRYLRRVRDFAEVEGATGIDRQMAAAALTRLGVDEYGLDTLDRRILKVVARGGGHPVGLKTISVSVGEEERTIEEVYEPYLIRMGFLIKTPRGRMLGNQAEEVAGLDLASHIQPLQGSFWEAG
ncbi:MAG: Holliday junction branch migration DNA helicase RuvB [Planctomycetota bacterium]